MQPCTVQNMVRGIAICKIAHGKVCCSGLEAMTSDRTYGIRLLHMLFCSAVRCNGMDKKVTGTADVNIDWWC